MSYKQQRRRQDSDQAHDSAKMASSGTEGFSGLGRILKAVTSLHPMIDASIDLLAKKASHFLDRYEKIVLEDPEKLAKLEAALTLISFVLPGSFRSSDVVSELVYFATKMLALLHDLVYRKKIAEVHTYLWTDKTYFETVLTVLEYTEAFLELGATKLWGDMGKWLLIFTLQISKASLKVVLLFCFRSGMQHSPSLLLMRDKIRRQPSNKLTKENGTMGSALEEKHTNYKKPDCWSGRRSGRVIRSLESAPPKGFRDWKLPIIQHEDEEQEIHYFKSNPNLTNGERIAELAYILRPVSHLLAMFVCGEKSWKPWLLSLAVDLGCLHKLQFKAALSKCEKDELLRRKARLLIYLLRSPFYDVYSKSKIFSLIDDLARWIPGLELVSVPLKDYLPVWQKIYSHNWSN